MVMFRSNFLKLVTVLLAALTLEACTQNKAPLGSAENPIKFYFLPSVDAKMVTEKTKLIHRYLEEKTPYKYDVAVPMSYIAVAEAFGTKRADAALINTFGYLMAQEKYGVKARLIVVRDGSETYQSQIIARADGSIAKLEDINGKKVAYVDPASTSGYLLPAKLFRDKRIKPSETVFANRHDNVVTMVYQKQVDAGATYYSPKNADGIQDARRLVRTQLPDVEKIIKVVSLSEPLPNDPVVFRGDMPQEMVDTIANALKIFIKTPAGLDAFSDTYGVTDFKDATDATYEPVRAMLKTLGTSADALNAKKKL